MKTSSKDFLKIVSEIVKEEVALVVSSLRKLNEGAGEQLMQKLAVDAKVKNIDDLRKWVFDKYFSEKNQGKPWFDPSVTPETVFDALVGPNSPISPRGALQVWKSIPGLQRSFSAMTDKDLASAAKLVGAGKEKKYTTGDEKLKDIGSQLGDVSKTMINKYEDSAMEKIKSLLGSASVEDMDSTDFDEISQLIDQARMIVAKEFAEKLKAYRGDTKSFINDLVKTGVVTANELSLLSDNEIGGLTMLAGKSPDEIVSTLLNDIDQDNNVYKTYQNAVSKKVFPNKQRGRPKKTVDV